MAACVEGLTSRAHAGDRRVVSVPRDTTQRVYLRRRWDFWYFDTCYGETGSLIVAAIAGQGYGDGKVGGGV